jgi:hypothetical protein
MDLEIEKEVKVRKDNLYVYADKYKLTNLTLDLWTSELFIDVVFYKNNSAILLKRYTIPTEKGKIDIDVDKIIDELHITIDG